MKIVAAMIAVAAALSLAGTVHAQDAAAEARTAAAAQAQTPDARIQAALAAAIEAGIPVSLLESKIAEGRAKRVPMDRIAAAVEARLDGLVRASQALAQARLNVVTEADLAVAADAMQAGVDASTIVEIARSAPENRRAVAIAILADLVELGLGSEAARARVDAALSRGPQALANLRAEAAASLRARRPRSSVGAGANAGIRNN